MPFNAKDFVTNVSWEAFDELKSQSYGIGPVFRVRSETCHALASYQKYTDLIV